MTRRRILPTKLLCVTAAVLMIAAGAAGCGSSSGTSSGSASPATAHYVHNGTFVMATTTALGSFDPYKNAVSWQFSYLTYDSLVNLKPSGAVVSGLASKWSSHGKKTTFTLRSGVTCSDGSPLTATQVASDLRYLGNPSDGNPLYGLVTPPSSYTVGVNAATRVITVTTRQPYGFMLQTLGTAPIVCAKGVKDPSSIANRSDGTGPFVLTSVIPGNSYTFAVRRGYHWGPEGASTSAPGTPAKLIIRVITNETTQANLLLAGQINAASLTGSESERVASAGHFQDYSDPITIAAALYNEAPGRPTASEPVRRALTEALNRSKLFAVSTAGVFGGKVETNWEIIPPGECAADMTTGTLPAYNLAAAGKLLDQAGWTKGPNGIRAKNGHPLSLTVVYEPASFPTDVATAELMTQELQALGVKVNLNGVDSSQAQQVLYQTHNFDIAMFGQDVQNPAQLVPLVSGAAPPKGLNILDLHNQTYNRLAAKATLEPGASSCPTWQAAERSLYQQLDTVPISQSAGATFLKGATAQTNGVAIPIPTSIKLLK